MCYCGIYTYACDEGGQVENIQRTQSREIVSLNVYAVLYMIRFACVEISSLLLELLKNIMYFLTLLLTPVKCLFCYIVDVLLTYCI